MRTNLMFWKPASHLCFCDSG